MAVVLFKYIVVEVAHEIYLFVFEEIYVRFQRTNCNFYPTALKGCPGIVFTRCPDGRAAGKSLSGLYLRNRKV